MEQRKLDIKSIRRASNSTSLALIVYIGLYIVMSLFYEQIVTDPLRSLGITLSDNSEFLLRYVLIYGLVLPLGGLALWLARDKSQPLGLGAGFRKPEKPVGWTLKWILIAVGGGTMLGSVPTLIATVLQYLLGTFTMPTDDLFLVQPMTVISVPKALCTILPPLIFAPVFEELFFRGCVAGNNKKAGELFTIVISGVFFGLWHQNLAQIFGTAFFGMFAAFLYLRTKSIFPAMIAHFFNNSIVIVRELIASRINTEGLKFDPIGVIREDWLFILLFLVYCFLMGSALMAGTVLMIIEIVKKHEFRFDNGNMELSLKEKFIAFFTAPITIVATIYLVVIIILNAIFGYYWFL